MIKLVTNRNQLLLQRFKYDYLWLFYYWNIVSCLTSWKWPYYGFPQVVKRSTNLSVRPQLKISITFEALTDVTTSKAVVKSNNRAKFLNLNFFSTVIGHSLTSYTNFTKPHGNFLLLFMDHNRYGSFTLNLKRCYSRWQNTYALVYNIFYYNYNLNVFGHKIFKFDILTLNTTVDITSLNLYKYTLLFHYFKDSIYGSNLVKVMKSVHTLQIETAFITDLMNNEKMARNLKVCDVYTVGIVAFNDDPWSVSYPVPVHANGLFTQYYFIRYIYHMKQNALLSRYEQYIKIWNSL
jgi:hypothetical protein